LISSPKTPSSGEKVKVVDGVRWLSGVTSEGNVFGNDALASNSVGGATFIISVSVDIVAVFGDDMMMDRGVWFVVVVVFLYRVGTVRIFGGISDGKKGRVRVLR